jgi:GGDEF domain-containing protein
MYSTELLIWTLMLGGLLALAGAALADVLATRSPAAWRGLGWQLLMGSSCVVISGLAEDLFPDFPATPALMLACSLGPLSGALTLSYLRQWLGEAAEDRWVHPVVHWGPYGLLIAGVLMAWAVGLQDTAHNQRVVAMAAALTGLAVLLAGFASVRAAYLGDKLARWMVLACMFLAISVMGLFTHRLGYDAPGDWDQILTAFCTVAYFQVVVGLAARRNQLNRKLKRLSENSQGIDDATGMPLGSVLLSKVDDAFWRSERLGADCTVIALHLRNLYALSELAGHGVDQQILAAMAARIRRAVGFRCVVGLYHPRCFVVVISAVHQPNAVERAVERLHQLLRKQLNVSGTGAEQHIFMPEFSIGLVTLPPGRQARAVTIIDQAEQKALDAEREARYDEVTAAMPF